MIAPGSRSYSISIPIINDIEREGAESFTFRIHKDGIAGAVIASEQITKTITIVDDDTSFVEISASTYTVAEDAGNLTFEVITSGEHQGFFINVAFGDDDDTAVSAQDYTPLNITRYGFAAKSSNQRSREQEYTVSLLDDTNIESDETLSISITIEAADKRKIQFPKGVSTYTKTFTIVDDDSTIVSVTNSTFNFDENETFENDLGETESGETAGAFTLKFSLSNATTVPVTFDVMLGDDNDTAESSDYTIPTNRTVTISAGSTTGSFSIPISNDAFYEVSELISYSLSNLVGANFSTGADQGTITINDDDADAIPILSVSNSSFNFAENDANSVLEISFSATLAAAASFSVNRSAPSGYTATAGTDFDISNNSTYTADNVSTFQVPLDIINDSIVESSETFTITLSNLSHTKFADGASMKSFTNNNR